MRKFFRIITIVLVLAFISIQFFRPTKNAGGVTPDHLFEKEKIPADIKSIIKNSCLDCHSNQTNYLWYHNIAPVSWLVNDHIVEGKSELNLSDWGKLDIFDKIAALEDIRTEIEDKKMPIKAYTALHKSAKLTDGQIVLLQNWTEKLGLELLAGIEE